MTTVSSSNSLSTYLANQSAAVTADSTAKSTSSSSSTNSWASVTGDFNTFLKVLTAQLSNQDPLNATDTNQFTQELVQFSQVEQQISTNDKLTQLVNQGKTTATQAMLNYIGKSVEVPTTNNQVILQNSAMQMAYTLPSAAESVSVGIYNSEGKLVTTLSDCPTKAATNRISWDGSLSDGSTATDGIYTFKITALGADGTAITPSDTRMIGKVTGMTIDSTNGNTLMVGTLEVDEDKVDAVFSNT